MEWYGRLNFLKGGLTYADMVTTVSPTHAREMTTAVGGFGLDHTFRGLGDRLVGIVSIGDVHKAIFKNNLDLPAARQREARAPALRLAV